jgi:hypothetical protein
MGKWTWMQEAFVGTNFQWDISRSRLPYMV